MDDGIASFCAAAVGAAYSQIMARVLRAPAPIFLVPAIIPLVPGCALYYTMSNVLYGYTEIAAEWGRTTVIEALAIALGMVSVLLAVGGIVAILRRVRLKRSGH